MLAPLPCVVTVRRPFIGARPLCRRLRGRGCAYITRNAGLDEAQAGIQIAGRNINNLRYADDTTLMAESKKDVPTLQGPCGRSPKRRGSLRFLPPVEVRPSSVAYKDTFLYSLAYVNRIPNSAEL